MKVFVSDQAKRDLLAIYAYVSRDNPAAAKRIIERISGRLEQLARFPFIGRERSSLAPGLRSLIAGNHLIFYVVAADRSRSCASSTAGWISTKSFADER